MKTIDAALQAHLDGGATTLAWCWRITRSDGQVLGFTNHDRGLTFAGTDFEPESGFGASEVRSGSDLSVDAQDAEGVLSSDRITEADILDGRWDNAEVDVWRVNWADTGQRVLMRRGAETMPTLRAVEREVERINASALLPPGVRIEQPRHRGAEVVRPEPVRARRTERDHQKPPQCRRPARTYEYAARRTLA